MHLNQVLSLLLTCCVSAAVFADSDAVEKYRDYTPQRLADLPESERQAEVPMMYSIAANTGLSRGSELLFSMQLNTLMYPGIDDYEKAVKSFQRDLGDDATGTLTVSQIHNLEERSNFQKVPNISFPTSFYSHKDDGYATVSGTMTIQDERIAWPVNHVELTCFKADKYCELQQLYLGFPRENSWGYSFNVTKDKSQYYDIKNWTGAIIDAIPSNPGSGCRVTTLNLNFETNEFYQITRNGSGDCEAMGVTLPKLERPRIAQIVDGEDIVNREFEALREKAFSFLSSTFRERVGKLRAEQSEIDVKSD